MSDTELNRALKLVGTVREARYQQSIKASDWWNAKPATFSCSSFVCWFYLQFYRLDLFPEGDTLRSAPQAGAFLSMGMPLQTVNSSNRAVGDILVYERLETEDIAFHARIYLGDIEAGAKVLFKQAIGCEVDSKVLRVSYNAGIWGEPQHTLRRKNACE